MVVARHHQHAAGTRGAGVVGVLEDVDASVDARPLAVPQREDAVAARRRQQVQLLRAPDRGGAEVFVDRAFEPHVVCGQERPGLVQRGVESGQRRAAVAGDEAGGVQPRTAVTLALQHRQPRECLHAGHEDRANLHAPAVVEGGFVAQHLHPVREKSASRCSTKAPMPSRAAAVQATSPNAR